MFDDVLVVYKFYGDLMFYVTGSQEENELIIFAVLQAFYESISLLLRCTPCLCGHDVPAVTLHACIPLWNHSM